MLQTLNLILRQWLVASLLLLSLAVHAAETESYFNFTFEDDLFAGRDYGYTGGAQLDWSKGLAPTFAEIAPAWMAAVAKPLWISNTPDQQRGISFKLGMMVYTPKDISLSVPPSNDLPYSGLLYWQGTLHAFDEHTADRVYLLLGIVGPASGAAWAQSAIHKLIGSQEPQGWDTQLDNEPVFKLGVARRWRAAHHDFAQSALGVDLVTNSELAAGNLESMADFSVSLRFGENLLRSYPTAGLLPGRDINPNAGQASGHFNIFVTVLARFQPNAIYVQGNTFGGKKTDLDIEEKQFIWSVGINWSAGNWGYEYAMQKGSPIFDGQYSEQTFGLISVTRRY